MRRPKCGSSAGDLELPKRQLDLRVGSDGFGVRELDGGADAGAEARVGLVVVGPRCDDLVLQADERRTGHLDLHVPLPNPGHLLLAHHVDLVAPHALFGVRGVATGRDRAVEEGPGQHEPGVPVGHVGHPAVPGWSRTVRGRRRPPGPTGEGRRERQVRPELGADRAGALLGRLELRDGLRHARVPRLRHLDRLVERRHVGARRDLVADVDGGVGRTDGGGEHALRDRQPPSRPQPPDVEPGQVGLGARQLDRRPQTRVDAALGEVAVDALALVRIVGRPDDGLRRETRRSRLPRRRSRCRAASGRLGASRRPPARRPRRAAHRCDRSRRPPEAPRRRRESMDTAPTSRSLRRGRADPRDVHEGGRPRTSRCVLLAVIAKSCAGDADRRQPLAARNGGSRHPGRDPGEGGVYRRLVLMSVGEGFDHRQ